MKTWTISFRYLTGCMALFLWSCGGGGGSGNNNGGQPAPVATTVTQVVGAAGSTITVTDPANALVGTTLTIPPGALSTETTITIEKVGPVNAAIPAGIQYVVKLGPEGTKFAAPVTVKLPLAGLPSPTKLVVLASSEDGTILEYRVDGLVDATARVASIDLTHFSTVAVIELPVPASGKYTYVIADQVIDGLPPPFSAAEASAIDKAMQEGALSSYYKCAGYSFMRLDYQKDIANADIQIARVPIQVQIDPDGKKYRPVSGFRPVESKAIIVVNTIGERNPDAVPPVTFPIVLYTGDGEPPDGEFDIKTIIAHELSHWMGIPAQRDEAYDSQGLFSRFYDGKYRTMGEDDKRVFLEHFPNCGTPVIMISATPATISPNSPTTINWSVANQVDSCTASGDWTGTKSAVGSSTLSVGAAIGTRTYTLTCIGTGGTAVASASVKVTAPSVGTGTCEQVSLGSSALTVKNQLPSGLEVFLPQFAFGADMLSGECNIVGLEFSGSVDVRVELTQCANSPANSDCTGTKYGPTRVRSISLTRGGSATLVVDPSTF
jgi:hypothetical protein